MIDVKKMVAMVICSAALAPLVPACGDEESGSCGRVQPCGGNLVGNYSISAACTTAAPTNGMAFGFNCPEATVGTPALSVSGSASFNADLTYTMTTTATATAQVMFPPACVASQTGGIVPTCDQINQLVPLLIASIARHHPVRDLRRRHHLHLHGHAGPADDQRKRLVRRVGHDPDDDRQHRPDRRRPVLRAGERAALHTGRRDDAVDDPGRHRLDEAVTRRGL